MSFKLKDNLNSKYFEAANALTSKKARHRIVAYVESYDDIYFWRTVLSEFENDKRYFEVMLPSKINLTRGKKSVLMNFLEGEPLGKDMIACVDADYDYLIQGRTHQSKRVLESPYVFHTYVYAIENYQCYAPSLHNVCVSVMIIVSSTFGATSRHSVRFCSHSSFGRLWCIAMAITLSSRYPISIALPILADSTCRILSAPLRT